MKQKFTKKDLRTGMLVENRKGQTGLVMLNTESVDAIVSNSFGNGRMRGDLSKWDDLLRVTSDPNQDIVKVFGLNHPVNNRDRASFSLDRRKLLWERAAETPKSPLEEFTNEIILGGLKNRVAGMKFEASSDPTHKALRSDIKLVLKALKALNKTLKR